MSPAKKEPEASASEGMFAKDKEIGLRVDTEFELREDFIIWDAAVMKEKVETKIGAARKTVMTVSKLDDPENKYEVATLGSAIADKAEFAVSEDFPAVVQLRKVAGRFAGQEALVLQFIRPYEYKG